MKELGGLRKPRPDSRNKFWKNTGFRGFADYMETEEFERGLSKLLELASKRRTAFMCAEAVPWRCHRSLIADALTARGHQVFQLITPGKAPTLHKLNPSAVVRKGKVSYPGPQLELMD